MALFKIFKGRKDNLGQAPGTGLQDTRQTHEGFAYFTPEDGKFYIDIADSNSAVVGTNRIPISADKADKDASGNVITSTYLTKAAGITNVAWNSTNKKLTKTINGSTTDVVTIGTIKTALALDKSDVGLGNVANIDQSKAIKSITRSGTTFTYTCLDDTTGTFTQQDNNTATAVDNILDGSNSGTAITYAPYTSKQSKLSFDTSTDFPTGTDRLNLNGMLYATKFQAEHLKNDAGEYRVTYGDTINMWLGVGNGNTNHGLYDSIASKWMIVADSSGNVTVNGNASTATNVAWSGVTEKPSTFTPSSHTHGNITNAGTITATQTIANGDKIVIVDSSDNSKVTGTTITFDGSTATKALTQKGTWETFNNYSLPTASNEILGGIKIGTGLNINSGVVSVNIADLGLSSAMHFIGVTTTPIEDGDIGKDSYAGISGYTKETPGDVILYNDTEFVWTGNYWELLGRDASFKVVQTPVTTATKETGTATTFVHSVTQDANGNITVKTKDLPTYNNYSLPLAASGTRGGIQIGYTENGKNYPVELSNEKAYVTVPWTDTNKYHKTGSWSGLTYTATAVNSADELKFTIPTASTSTAGAMTTDMVTKLNGIQESADAVSFTRSLTSGTKVGTITINGTGTDIYAPTNTDTKNTAGSTNTSSKIFLIGATSQAANPQTYSDDQVFTTSGVLTAKELVLSQTGARSITFSRTDGYNYIQTPAGGGIAICATDDNVSLAGSTLAVDATNVRPGQTNTYNLGTSSVRWKALYVGSAASYGGATTAPIYWNNGVPAAVTDISLVKSDASGSSINVGNENGSVKIFASLNRGLYDTTNSKWIVYTTKAGDHTQIPLWASKGASNQPVYFNSDGEPVAISYTIGKSVPSDAEFTDTTYSTLTQTLIDTGTETTGKLITAKLVKDNNTKVTQTVVTDNAEYAILAKAVSAVTTVTDTSKFAANVKLNPFLARLTATQIAYGVSGTAKAYTSYDSTDDSINFNFI